jgi:hypothetical protein
MRGTKLVEHKDPVTKQVVKTEAKRIYRCPKCGGEAPATIFGKRAKSRKCERQLEIREPILQLDSLTISQDELEPFYPREQKA